MYVPGQFHEWYDYGVFKVAQMSRLDEEHKFHLKETNERESSYVQAIASLDEEQIEKIDAYMMSLVDLQYQKTRLAYELGKLVGKGILIPSPERIYIQPKSNVE